MLTNQEDWVGDALTKPYQNDPPADGFCSVAPGCECGLPYWRPS